MSSATIQSVPTSLCSLPPWALASREFQADPWPIEILGVREAERRLFERLEKMTETDERGLSFHEYLRERFLLDQWNEHRLQGKTVRTPGGVAGRTDYRKFLLGWGIDSNSPSGAVLKGWVESRFGLRATYHKGILAEDAAAREAYAKDRMRGEAETMGITMQLDLLYTYEQYEWKRTCPQERWKTLYRGTHDPQEYMVEDAGTHCLVRLNNLSSFTADREIAWEFGSSVWKVQVPRSKIVFHSGLLPRHLLEGEQEHLVLGGEYRVELLRY